MVNAYQGVGHYFKSAPNYLQIKGQVITSTQRNLLTHLMRQSQKQFDRKIKHHICCISNIKTASDIASDYFYLREFSPLFL